MKIIILLFLIFLTSCSVNGSILSSQGRIVGWERSGAYNVKDGITVLFNVKNNNYIRMDETLLGVVTKDRKKNMEQTIGRKPFIIKVDIKSIDEGVFVKQTAKLILNNVETIPSVVKKGVDIVRIGQRKSNTILFSEYDDFMRIDEKLSGFDHNWLWLEFDMKTPSPEQKFILYLELKKDSSVEVLEVKFIPKLRKVFHH